METTTGARIKQWRTRKGISVEDFAAAAGVKGSAVYEWQKDRNKPSLDAIANLRTAYPDLNTDWLQFGEGEMFKGGRALTPAPTTDDNPESDPDPAAPGQMQVYRPTYEELEQEVRELRRQLTARNALARELLTDNDGLLTIQPRRTRKHNASADAADLRQTVDEIADEHRTGRRAVGFVFGQSHLRRA